ncbi:coagulation factor X-like [Oppia nitens]|uniref:coagulation factor X-like n=1 Tax=Oppia nitens TaxID=1686743 RepID=UPI0023DA760F|nr:coagulation factor X-like [Oppia nitens]
MDEILDSLGEGMAAHLFLKIVHKIVKILKRGIHTSLRHWLTTFKALTKSQSLSDTYCNSCRVSRINDMVVVQQKSLNDTIDPTVNKLSYDDIYSDWSKWSKCRRRCKQVRTRQCVSAEHCGTTIVKEERACRGGKCLTNPDTSTPGSTENQEVPHKGRGRSSQFRVLYHLQSYVYSQWSEWSSCTNNCRTRRSRSCEMKQICGNSIIQEDALCYIQGSRCETLYKEKPKNSDENSVTSDPISLFTPPSISASAVVNASNETKPDPIDDLNCGISSVLNDMVSNLRIIGGRESTKGRWPWMVSILNRYYEPFCGGTLIAPQFVITAAHCVRRRLYVRAGEHDLIFADGYEQQVRVSDIFVHPDYDAETVDNDIAVLRLRTPLKMNRFVAPACLPTPEDEMSVNSLGTILGWGKRRNSALFGTDVLHQAQVPIADINDCKEVYDNYFISPNMVCAGYKRGKVDSCAGDSGGPLLFSKQMTINDKTVDKWFVYGITSFGEGCGRKGRYGIYAKVPNLVKWIRKTIQRNVK